VRLRFWVASEEIVFPFPELMVTEQTRQIKTINFPLAKQIEDGRAPICGGVQLNEVTWLHEKDPRVPLLAGRLVRAGCRPALLTGVFVHNGFRFRVENLMTKTTMSSRSIQTRSNATSTRRHI